MTAWTGRYASTYTRSDAVTVHGVELLPRVLEVARCHHLDLGDIADAMLAPESTWPGQNGSTVVHLRGDVAAISDEDRLVVVGVSDREHALKLRQLPRTGAVPRAHGAGKGRRFPSTVEDLTVRLRERGFEVETTSRHLAVRHPEQAGCVPIPRGPSDWRAIPNAVLQIRRMFGIDVRE